MPARYLLRLGMGEAELATTLDFSRVGRVNAMLARRLELLAEVSARGPEYHVTAAIIYFLVAWLRPKAMAWGSFKFYKERTLAG